MRQVVGPVPPGRDPEEYDRLRRRILWMLPTGIYALGTRSGPSRNLMTISWVTQVATEPKLVGVGVERAAVTHGLLVSSGVFALSILPRDERALVRRFAKPVTDQEVDPETGAGTMNGAPVRAQVTGAPILDVALAWIDCEVRHRLDFESHSWFVGEVMACGAPGESSASESESASASAAAPPVEAGVLRMEDTRMNYGG
ncbi:MAG TPA: flavin reductase family protein [Acidimicrobiales bacterium]|nr:flavin reductase family protein [Acidimicrobiales bacterium]